MSKIVFSVRLCRRVASEFLDMPKMASNHFRHQASLISDITECSVCCETFVNPRCLPCIHTFCLCCLENFAINSLPGDSLPCPLCRKEFAIPAGGLGELPANFVIGRVLEVGGDLRGLVRGLECEVCGEREAREFCEECAQKMCRGCAAPHGKLSATRLHKVIALVEAHTPDIIGGCETHPDTPLTLYCQNCDLPLCPTCSVAPQHSNHRLAKILELTPDLIHRLEASCLPLSECLAANHSELEKLKASSATLLEQVVLNEQLIFERCDQIKRLIDEQCKLLQDKLLDAKNQGLKRFHARQNEVEGRIATLESMQSRVQKLMGDKVPALELALEAKNVFEKLERLLAEQGELSKGGLSPVQIAFKVAEMPPGSGREETGLVGELIYKESIREKTLIMIGPGEAGVTSTGKDCCSAEKVYLVSLSRPESVIPLVETAPAEFGLKLGAVCVALGDKLYAVGIGRLRNQLWSYTDASDWTRLADMLSIRRKHCVAFVDSTLYAIGGYFDADQSILSDVIYYDVVRNEWHPAGELGKGVYDAACVAFRGKIFVFGGYSKGPDDLPDDLPSATDCVHMFDPVRREGSRLRMRMPEPDFAMAAAVWHHWAVVVSSRACCVYDFEKDTWAERNQFRIWGDLLAFALDGDSGMIYVAGGGEKYVEEDGTKKMFKGRGGKKEKGEGVEGGRRGKGWVEVKCVGVEDIVEDREGMWRRHGLLPWVGPIHAYCPTLMFHWNF